MATVAKQRKRLALDTNVLLDLAAGRDFALAFRKAFENRGYSFFVTPTVIQELAYLTKSRDNVRSNLALTALKSLKGWNISPYDLRAVGHGIAERFALKLIARNLLPDGEINDGQILAEAALADLQMLVTSDAHILDICSEDLILAFDESDLPKVHAASPRRLLSALKGKP